MVLAAATALSLGACAEGEETNKKPVNPNAPDYSDSTLQMDFYGYSPPTDGTYTLDGQTFTTGEDYRTPERYKEYMDCGMTIFDQETQDTHAGGSGCGCAAVTLASYVLPRIERGEWKRVLFLPTGALMSTVSFNEGASVPGIAHGIMLVHC